MQYTWICINYLIRKVVNHHTSTFFWGKNQFKVWLVHIASVRTHLNTAMCVDHASSWYQLMPFNNSDAIIVCTQQPLWRHCIECVNALSSALSRGIFIVVFISSIMAFFVFEWTKREYIATLLSLVLLTILAQHREFFNWWVSLDPCYLVFIGQAIYMYALKPMYVRINFYPLSFI